jgi:SAM-dependent methyltransferase
MPVPATASARLFSAACERNRAPMLAVLRRVLPARGRALEVASGTGQHVAWFAAGLPGWHWQPTDADEAHLSSIAAWTAGGDDGPALANVAPPLRLDVRDDPWPLPAADGDADAEAGDAGGPRYDAILCANMLHIAPWPACGALMRGAARHLAPGGVLLTYGPYLEDEVPTAPGNREFDAFLRARDPASGLRRLADVRAQAAAHGLALRERVAMPANNLMLVFARAATP